jgi:predicted DNA-binding transcriptional regulator AlpA
VRFCWIFAPYPVFLLENIGINSVAMKKLYNCTELAEMFGVCTKKLLKLHKDGDLPPSITIGKSLRWTEESINQWLEGKQAKSDNGKESV